MGCEKDIHSLRNEMVIGDFSVAGLWFEYFLEKIMLAGAVLGPSHKFDAFVVVRKAYWQLGELSRSKATTQFAHRYKYVTKPRGAQQAF